jgi:hypothetical protein
MSETNHVPLSKIRNDGGAQMRAGIDDETVAEYTERYLAGAKMPPLVVFNDGENYWLADGFHRLQALLASGTPNALCEINKGTQRDAVLFACGANASHGLRRTNGDKRRAVGRLLRDEEWSRWTDRRIAQTCGVDNSFVSRLRKEMGGVDEQHLPATRTGSDGKNYPAQRRKPVAKPVEDESTYDPGEGDGEVELFDASRLPTEPSPAFVVDERRMQEFREVSGYVSKILAHIDAMQPCPQLASVEDPSTRKMLENAQIKVAAFYIARLPEDATTRRPAFRVIEGGNKSLPKRAETTRDAEEASISACAISSILERATMALCEQSHHIKGYLLSQDEALRLQVAIRQLREGIAEIEANLGAR